MVALEMKFVVSHAYHCKYPILQLTFAVMLEPIHIENETLIVQSFDASDLKRWPGMVNDIFALLSDNQALKYLPFKRLKSVKDADAMLKNALISLHCGRNYLHFIRKKSDGRIIGLIDLISPELAKGPKPYKILN